MNAALAPSLSAADRCDRCGAQAFVRARLHGGGELLFCAHHGRKHAPALEGHADNVGAMETNQKLSEERAAAVGKALVERGVPEQRIRTAGFSSRRPVASNTTPDGRRLNRRVELVLLEEKVENLTKGEPVGAFASAWDQLKTLIDQGLVKPVEKP